MTACRRQQLARLVARAFQLLVCTLGVSLAVGSCVDSIGEGGFSAEEFDAVISRLVAETPASASHSAFAVEDSLCAGASPDSVTGMAVDSSIVANPAAQGMLRFRDRVRTELARMEFRACVRAMSRTVQRDAWLRHDRFTELVAWKGEATIEEAIYVPVRFRVPVWREGATPDSSWVRPIAAVLEAVRAFLADSTRIANRTPSDGAARKPIVLSFTTTEESNELSTVPAAGESRQVSATWVGTMAGPQSPRVTTPDVGWMVGRLRASGGRVPFPGRESGLPVRISDLKTGLPNGALCESGKRCDLIVPAQPPVHVHAVFFPGGLRVEAAEARRMGERTLEVLLAVDTLSYGDVLPVSTAELKALWWWLLPCALLVFTVGLAFLGLLGSFNAAIRTARRARRVTGSNRFLASVWLFVLSIVLPFRQRFASKWDIGGSKPQATTTPKHRFHETDEALHSWAGAHVGATRSAWADELLEEGRAEQSRIGRWAKEADDWEYWGGGLCGRVQDCKKVLKRCVREAEEALSKGKTDRERMAGIGSSLRRTHEQLELVKQLKREAREAREFGKKTRRLAGRADRWVAKVKRRAGAEGPDSGAHEAGSGKAAEARANAARTMGTAAGALRAAAKAARWEARALRASTRELRVEAELALQNIARLRYDTVHNALSLLIARLRKGRDARRDHLATSFSRLGRVLASFCTLTWNWRVFACGFAALVAAVHGFVIRVDDPILNVALSGVSEDVWALVYVGLGAIVFLASALEAKEYSIGGRAGGSLLYWNKMARRIRTQSKRPVSLLTGLKRRLQWACRCYVLLLLVIILIATSGELRMLEGLLSALRHQAAPPVNPYAIGKLNLNYAILLFLLIAFFLPPLWVWSHLKRVPQDGS